MKTTDILYSNTNVPTWWFYHQPEGTPTVPDRENGYWVWELCRCCGARLARTEEEFNNPAVWKEVGWSYEGLSKVNNLGITVILNPDKEKLLPIEGSIIDFVQCGDDVLGLRLKPV